MADAISFNAVAVPVYNLITQGVISGSVPSALPSGAVSNIPLDNSGAQYNTPIHGPYSAASLAGRTFVLATGAAGTTIPVQATNLVSTFTLLNPSTSNVYCELLTYQLGILNATTVVASIDLYYQYNGAALATTTPLTIRPAYIGNPNAASACTGYSAATYTNTVGTNFFRIANLATFGAVTTTNATPIVRKLSDDGLLLYPGTSITVAGTAAQTQAMTQTLSWVEWPLPR